MGATSSIMLATPTDRQYHSAPQDTQINNNNPVILNRHTSDYLSYDYESSIHDENNEELKTITIKHIPDNMNNEPINQIDDEISYSPLLLEYFIRDESNIRLLHRSNIGRSHFISYLQSKHPRQYSHMLTNYNRSTLNLIRYLFSNYYLISNDYKEFCAEKLQLTSPQLTTENLLFLESLILYFRRLSDIYLISNIIYLSSHSNISSEIYNYNWYLLKIATIIENAPIVAYLTIPDKSKDFPIIFANLETEKVTGFSRSTLHGQANPFFVNNIQDEEEESKALINSIVSCEPRMTILTIKYANHSLSQVRIRNQPLCDKLGRHRFTLTVQENLNAEFIFDITSAIFLTLPPVISREDDYY